MNGEAGCVDVALFDMVMSFSRAIDLLHPAIGEHHLRVAYLSARIAELAGFSGDAIQDIIVAGALHDIAAVCQPYSLPLLDKALTVYDGDMTDEANIHEHAEEGYLMLHDFPPFTQAATIIRFHHVDWRAAKIAARAGHAIPLASHILRLADRLAVLPREDLHILAQKNDICSAIRTGAGAQFLPMLIEIFDELSAAESFWLDFVSKYKENILRQRTAGGASGLAWRRRQAGRHSWLPA
ncbi:HD domain-containing protein [Janthinobacterium sp. 17J80-10]|uniref:HD-GYP domain-containing protein n=1 Tax=Janthinobacterium sp. 17J80-10 TaxID=2497863 RepID=UPI0010054D0E|nr:HD domain-containing protein [Janthinobacterium sp. 17J80-10]QAU33128.1 HD domain-containing protein [Janthinobacterium sp. 17J80-10]